ncbi:MAG: hypothetical protein IKT99_03705 [Oscillospiraceae bacterium]|nr:hypothetical protein [Oscillospiraceae bacterium]
MKKRTIMAAVIVLLLLSAAVLLFRNARSGRLPAEPAASAAEQTGEASLPALIEDQGED